MIISGSYICLQADKDFEPFDDKQTPVVIWFNLKNIVALACYEDDYRLIIDDEHVLTLKSEAASELIRVMRKKRDDKVHGHMNNMTPAEKKVFNQLMEKYVIGHKKEDE